MVAQINNMLIFNSCSTVEQEVKSQHMSCSETLCFLFVEIDPLDSIPLFCVYSQREHGTLD